MTITNFFLKIYSKIKILSFIYSVLKQLFNVISNLLKKKVMSKVFSYENLSDKDLRHAIDASVEKKSSKIYAASRLAKFFSIDLTIKIFGYPLIEWHYPPQSGEDPLNSDDSMFND